MPSVASEAHAALSSRAHASQLRSNAKADSSASSTPFADLLDNSAPPEAPPAPRQTKSERPERSDRPERSKSADDRGSDAAPAKETAAKSDAGAKDSKTVKEGEDSKEAAAPTDSKEAKAGAETEKTAETAEKPATDADAAAALDAMFADTMPEVTAPQVEAVAVTQPVALAAAATAPAAEAADATVEADALAALQAAATQAGTPKPAQQQSGTQGKTDAKAATPAGATDPQAAVPQVEGAKEGQSQSKGEKAPGEFHRAAADLVAKLDTAASTMQGGAVDAAAAKPGADAAQALNVIAPAHTAAATAGPAAATAAPVQAQAQAAAVPLTGLAVEIATQAQSGKNHFEIRLDPPELGRINVHLDVDRDGNVNTKLVVDRADTLDLLKRDASSLERALQQAGLKTSDSAMEFSLRQHSFAQDDTGAQNTAGIVVSDEDPAPLEALRQGYGRLLGLGGGLDIRV